MPYSNSELTNYAIGGPVLVSAGIGFIVVGILIYLVLSAKKGNELMEQISDAIHEGAKTFLKLEYTALSVLAAFLFILICVAIDWRTGLCYLFGCFCSAFCGFVGMMICTKANVKTAAAAETSLNGALRVAFNAGSVMGLTVVSIALALMSVFLMIWDHNAIGGKAALAGLGMGASTVSIFARVGGGIFTKAADVGADLVGKVEKNLPEDDIRNPATIADNVGDNVGDVAGMGADLFSSFVGSTVAAALLGIKVAGQAGIALPFWIMMSGMYAAIIGILVIRTKENATQADLLHVIRFGQFVAAAFQIGFMAIVVYVTDLSWNYLAILIIGLVAGLCIGLFSEFFTSSAFPMTRGIAQAGRVGPANVVISGIAVGSFSCVPLAFVIAAVILSSYNIAGGFYGVALTSCGLLSTLGITLATDAYGPVADNAGGIAEMAGMPAKTRENTDKLDALGNTTAAIGKGFAVGSAILTSISLLATFMTRIGLLDMQVMTDRFTAGLLLGSMLPFWFAALTMQAVHKAAQSVITEVRRQFREIKGLMEGEAKADHSGCVHMVTKCALHAMVYPVLVVVLTPLITGIGLGPHFLVGLVLGADVTGFMLGFMMSISGGSWDNAKKYVEEGHYGGKKSDVHKATVVGDTIGDPFKDTSGPALNILIKLISYNTVVLSSIYKKQADFWWVSLILIGVLIVFIPFWEWMTPAPMRRENIEAIYRQLAGENQDAKNKDNAIVPSSSSDDVKGTVSTSNVELQELPSEGHWKVIMHA